MSTERPWGMPVQYPLEDILRLARPKSNSFVWDLGCGKPKTVFTLQQALHGQVCGFDFNPELQMAAQTYGDENWPVNFFQVDLNNLFATAELFGALSADNTPHIIIANNLFCNLPNPYKRSWLAGMIAWSLQPNGWLFFLDHLRKDRPPFGTDHTHQEYATRYRKAVLHDRPEGDVWTNHPPRWVHHFSWREIFDLFPARWFRREVRQYQPYVGDSGKESNAVYFVAQKIATPQTEDLATIMKHHGIL